MLVVPDGRSPDRLRNYMHQLNESQPDELGVVPTIVHDNAQRPRHQNGRYKLRC